MQSVKDKTQKLRLDQPQNSDGKPTARIDRRTKLRSITDLLVRLIKASREDAVALPVSEATSGQRFVESLAAKGYNNSEITDLLREGSFNGKQDPESLYVLRTSRLQAKQAKAEPVGLSWL